MKRVRGCQLAPRKSRPILRRHAHRYRRDWHQRFYWVIAWRNVDPGVRYALQRIAACESGGNPGAISPTGLYRGKYQFDYGTWASVGGYGDPAAASEREQDVRASYLYRARGAQPWPICG